jgi:hypothetical protein
MLRTLTQPLPMGEENVSELALDADYATHPHPTLSHGEREHADAPLSCARENILCG